MAFSAILLASCSLLSIGPRAERADPACKPPINASPDAIRWDDGRHLCYLGALAENIARSRTATPDDREIILGDAAIYLAMLGEDVASRHAIAAMIDPALAPKPDHGEAAGLTGRRAREEILGRAALSRALIINEAHHVPRHREFVRHLLPGLRALGYTHLAAEALAPDLAPSAASTRLPDEAFGGYLRDPAFVRLMQDARMLGFHIVPYEAPPQESALDRVSAMQVRERSQARTLFDRTFAAVPDAKLVVLVGYDHIEETPRARSDGRGDFYWMATELKRLSGIDPLTVDQTTLNAEAHSALEAPSYRPLLSGLASAESVVIFDGASPAVLGRYKGRVDLQVLHPPSAMIQGREAWRWEGARVISPRLPSIATNDPGLFLAQAHPSGDIKAAPIDQVVVSAANPSPLLAPKTAKVDVTVTRILPTLSSDIDRARRGGLLIYAPASK